ncbi:hypothetical protein ACWGQ5_38305 [Streptomyces sp. NPDC055722]
MGGPTQIAVLGYADDDNDWPDNATHENLLGGAVAVIDPADPLTLGNRQLGPTETDNGNAGFLITMTSEVPPLDSTPDLEITGLEVTQAIRPLRLRPTHAGGRADRGAWAAAPRGRH